MVLALLKQVTELPKTGTMALLANPQILSHLGAALLDVVIELDVRLATIEAALAMMIAEGADDETNR